MTVTSLREGQAVAGARLIQHLGSGESGDVWSALSEDGKLVAVKIYSDQESAMEKAEHEYHIAKFFSHENLLSPLAMTKHETHPVILLPYCEGRSVDGVAAHITEVMAWQLAANISNALTEIHGKGYAHFDIKPSNILWDGKKFLLADFGGCTTTEADKDCCATAADASSFRFDAPERLTHASAACDIWSLGATIFYLYMGCHVFNGLGGRAQHKDSPLPYMRKSLPALSELVRRCLDFEADKRPSADEICAIAQQELQKLSNVHKERKPKPRSEDVTITDNDIFWPEEMVTNN